jgi:glutamate-1-semialdehyde aminotransferase
MTAASAKGEAVAAMLAAADEIRSEARHLNDKARQLEQGVRKILQPRRRSTRTTKHRGIQNE